MRTNGFAWSFNGNDDPKDSFEIRLSTGYTVEIGTKDPSEAFRNLGKALLGEIFLEEAKQGKKGPEGQAGAKAVFCEIDRIVGELNVDDAKLLLKISFARDFVDAFDLVNDKPKQKKKRR